MQKSFVDNVDDQGAWEYRFSVCFQRSENCNGSGKRKFTLDGIWFFYWSSKQVCNPGLLDDGINLSYA
jgi:hypothetical protein